MDTNQIKQEVEQQANMVANTVAPIVQQTLTIGQRVASMISNGWHVIMVVFACVMIGASGFFIYRRFFHKSGIVEKPQVAVTQDFTKTDFSNEENLIEYVGSWLAINAPFVLENCVPNHIPPKDCKVPLPKTQQASK